MFPRTLIRFKDLGELSLASPCLPEAQRELSSVLSAQCLLLPVQTGAAGLRGGIRINPWDSQGLGAATTTITEGWSSWCAPGPQLCPLRAWGEWKINWKHSRRIIVQMLTHLVEVQARSFPRVVAQAWKRPGCNNWHVSNFQLWRKRRKSTTCEIFLTPLHLV